MIQRRTDTVPAPSGKANVNYKRACCQIHSGVFTIDRAFFAIDDMTSSYWRGAQVYRCAAIRILRLGVWVLVLLLSACATVGDKQSSAGQRGDSGSDYEAILPALNGASHTDPVRSGRAIDADVPGVDGVSGQPDIRITPVVVLSHSYTIQLGLFDTEAEASQYAHTLGVLADEIALAEVVVDDSPRFLLALGVFGDVTQAEHRAKALSQRATLPLAVKRLSEIESIAVTPTTAY